MKILSLILIAVVTITLLLVQGCTKDVLVVPNTCDEINVITYDDVRQILTGSCGAGSTQCHIPGGFGVDYTSWNPGMEASLTRERFENEVLIKGTMPQQGWPPLDSIELQKIKCWVEGDYQR